MRLTYFYRTRDLPEAMQLVLEGNVLGTGGQVSLTTGE